MARQLLEQEAIILHGRAITERLLKIMRNHIGREKMISRLDLFKKVYLVDPNDVSEIKEWVMWDFIKKALHYMRQRTKCFVVSTRVPTNKYSAKHSGVWHYWVATDLEDAKTYADNLERNIKAMRQMEKKAERAVRLKWYKEEWSLK